MVDQYLFSVDGGGTKTAFCIYNLSDSSRKYAYSGSSNYRSIGRKTAQENIIRTFEKICTKYGISKEQIAGCVFGLSGFDTNKDYRIYENMIETLGIDKSRIYVCNDSELLFYSEAKAPGIAVVCGTGSIALGINEKGQKIRVGGWGSNISDFGSGYWIGLRVIQSMLLHYDGYGENETVFTKLKELYDISSDEKIPAVISSLNNYQIASCAKLVAEFAEQGDHYCEEIVQNAVEHLCTLINLVYCRLDFQKEEEISVVLGGSLFKNTYFNTLFKERLADTYNLHNLRVYAAVSNPIDGGINIAINKFLDGK